MRSSDPTFAVLRSLLLFDGVPRRRLRQLRRQIDDIELPAGAVLIERGQANRHAYVVTDGRLAVSMDGTRVGTVGPGEIVGERAALTREAANATVVADTDCSLLVIDHRTLIGLATEVPSLLGKLRFLIDARELAAA